MTTTFVDVPLGSTSAEIQSMIDISRSGTTFRLQEGTYHFDTPILINQDNVSLIGAGRSLTTITIDSALGGRPAIQIGHEILKPVIDATFSLRSTARTGDTSIRLTSGHDLQVGEFIYLAEDNTPQFLDSIGDEKWRKDNPLRIAMAEVTAVNGNTIVLDSPLTFDFDPAITTVQRRDVVSDNKLSGFTLIGPYGEADPGDFNNVVGSGKGHSMITLGGTTDAVISDLGILDGISHGVTIAGTTDLTMTDFFMDGTQNKGSGGNGYAIWVRDVFDSNFSNLHIVDTRHAILFGSYNTAGGNNVHISYTNRDVNFHGGRDRFNTVVVDQMIRNEEEQRYRAWATFYNQGEKYGAPTDPTTNPIEIRTLVATSRGDSVVSHSDGSAMWGMGGKDTIRSGAGDDYINGGSGSDEIYASDGHDTIDGDSNNDTLIFEGAIGDYTITTDGTALYFTHAGGRVRVTNIEDFEFADDSLSDRRLMKIAGEEANPEPDTDPTPPYDLREGTGSGFNAEAFFGTDTTIGPVSPDIIDIPGNDTPPDIGSDGPLVVFGSDTDWSPMDTTAMTVIDGASGWEREQAAQSFVMGPELNAMDFADGGEYDVAGNALDNNMIGNNSVNRMEGGAGKDRIFGQGGNDTLLGGDGDDYLHGHAGDDALFGGDGNDTIDGGTGNDVFLAGAGNDLLNGGSGLDTLIFTGSLNDYTITGSNGNFSISDATGTTDTTTIESFVFNGTLVASDTLIRTWNYAQTASGTLVNGTAQDDRLQGLAGNDTLQGSSGNDTLQGRAGADHLYGGAGDDFLYGEAYHVGLTPIEARQVYRFYNAILGRDPDMAGYLGWTQALTEHTVDVTQMAASFVGSAEFQATYGALDDAEYIGLLYSNVLGRAPAQAEVDAWLTSMANGNTREGVALGFSDSAEFQKATNAVAQTFADMKSPSIWADDVFRLYQAALGRTPDLAGFLGWAESLGSGQVFSSAVIGFVASAEFQNAYNTLDDEGFVTLLYQNVLGRDPAQPEIDAWLHNIAGGACREEVVEGFSQSQEFITGTADALKSWVRSQGWHDQLDGGTGTNVLAGSVMADQFIFDAADHATDIVLGLEAWDALVFNNFGYTSAADATDHMTEVGDDTVFIDQGFTIVLAHTSLNQIADDMIM